MIIKPAPIRKIKRFSQTYVEPKTKRFKKPQKKRGRPKGSGTGIKKDWGPEKQKWNEVWKSESFKGYSRWSDWTLFEKTRKKAFKKKIEDVVWELRWKWRHDGWGGARFSDHKRHYPIYMKGPKEAIQPKLLFQIQPTMIFEEKYLKRATTDRAGYLTVLEKVNKALQKVREKVVNYGKSLIQIYVPKETGALRVAMFNSLTAAKVEAVGLIMKMSTGDIDYATIVNGMPSWVLQHNRADGVMGKRSNALLHDPKAIQGWFEYICGKIRTKLGKEIIPEFYDEVYAAWAKQEFVGGGGGALSGVDIPRKQEIIMERIPKVVEHRKTGERWLVGKKGGTEIMEKTRKVIYKEAFRKTSEDVVMGAEEKEMYKHQRMMQLWKNKAVLLRRLQTTYIDKEDIMKMFKIRGL